MTKYAIIDGNLVSNIIITEDKEQSEKNLSVVLVESTEENPAKIGDFYIEGKFVTPVQNEEGDINA